MIPVRRASEELRRTDLRLDPDRIIATAAVLRDRIRSEFPGRGLGLRAEELLEIAEGAVERIRLVSRPNLPLRAGIALVVLLLLAGVLGIAWTMLNLPLEDGGSFFEFVQAVDAAVNEFVLLGAALFFLVTLESRLRRRRALRFIRELRALAHILDMYQLSKDPAVASPADGRGPEGADPEPAGRSEEVEGLPLVRYLDYCSEMLSIVSKIAALYAQSFDDPVVLAAVDEVESLTSGLSQKIWQKIMILDRGLD